MYDLFLVNPFITLLKLLFTFGPIVKLNTVLFDDIPPCSLTYPSDCSSKQFLQIRVSSGNSKPSVTGQPQIGQSVKVSYTSS